MSLLTVCLFVAWIISGVVAWNVLPGLIVKFQNDMKKARERLENEE